jgi:CRISPR-associated protein Cas1
VKQHRQVVMEIPFKQLRHIIVAAHGITLSSDVITLCARERVPIDFLDYHGEPLARLCTPLDSLGNTGLQQLRMLHDGSGLRLAKAFVYGKLKNQINLVKYYHKYRKRVDEVFSQTFTEVEQKFNLLLNDLKAFAPGGEDYDSGRQRLLAFEGQGGNLYWRMIRLLLEDDVEFPGRERRGATDLVNSLLNYGYGMLYPRVHHALVLAGLNPCVSFLHTPQDDKPTLVFDMIEEFRPQAVDRVIFGMITKGEALLIDPKEQRLTRETVQKVIRHILERLATPVPYRRQDKPLQDVIQLQAKLLAAHLHGKGTYRPFVAPW